MCALGGNYCSITDVKSGFLWSYEIQTCKVTLQCGLKWSNINRSVFKCSINVSK